MDTRDFANKLTEILRMQPYVDISQCVSKFGVEYLRVWINNEEKFIVTITESE